VAIEQLGLISRSVADRAPRRVSTPGLALPLVVAIAVAQVLVQLGFSTRYGYHRDELYFLAAARHLAWGYVDQPPLTPALAWLARTVFGDSLAGLRLFSILAGGAAVILGGLLARELGGGRYAQGLAALCMAVSTLVLLTGHLFGTTAFDQLAWTLGLYLVARLLRTGDERLWLLVGLVAGVGLLNKHLVLFFGFGLVAGLLLTEQRRRLASPWLWLGGALALLMWSTRMTQAASRACSASRASSPPVGVHVIRARYFP
jgi:dolichyl-phosphate-mannose-protein mannosyltransferase